MTMFFESTVLTNEDALKLLDDATCGYYNYHGCDKRILTNDATRTLFNNLNIYPFYSVNSNGKRILTDTKHEDNKCYVSIKNNNFYGNHAGNNDYINFSDAIKGFVTRNDIIDSMVYFGCTDNRTPSIELIQWSDYFLLLIKSANMIGEFKCFVSKDIIFDIFNISII